MTDQESLQHQKTVLIVDDEQSVRQLFGAMLTRAGFNVHTAEDGLDALQSIREHVPNAIVLDLNMPRMNGAEFRRQLMARPHTRQIPVVVVTGVSADPLPNVAATLRKPVTVEDLIAAVSQAVSPSRPARQSQNTSSNGCGPQFTTSL